MALMVGKAQAAPRTQCACFVTKASVDAAPPEQIDFFLMRTAFLSSLLILLALHA